MNKSPRTERLLPIITPGQVRRAAPTPPDARTLAIARRIIDDVQQRGFSAVLEHARRLGDLPRGFKPVYGPRDLKAALDALPREHRRVLAGAANRITRFARAQRACVKDLDTAAAGLRIGHRVTALDSAGCYAPGGRFPLPSSVLMTACTARAAGVRTVWCASPRPAPATLAAAALAGADGLLGVGGAQAIAALALGAGEVPACAIVCGPGNRFVTAAKQLLSGRVSIDMLAGPSEVLVIADDSAEPGIIAADMLAQAEHDTDACAILVTTSRSLVDAVEGELHRQLADLPTATIARAALRRNGRAVVVASIEQAVRVSDELAPEHLEIQTRTPRRVADRCTRYGGIFVGARSAEVIGDYGVGPNHVLPTAGTGRFSAGLSVMNFLKARTYVRDGAGGPAQRRLLQDTARFARIEGLEAHARAVEMRYPLR